MSGLEKLEKTNAWFARFKNLLLMERTQATYNSEGLEPTASTNTTPLNYSLDLSEDFRVILEEKKIPKQRVDKDTKMEDNLENKENAANNYLRTGDTPTKKFTETTKPLYSLTTKPNLNKQRSYLIESGDISFEALEKMCDKSASDPDSTLFSYLKTMHEETANDTIKDTSNSDLVDPYDAMSLKDTNLFNKSVFANQTQLNEIEAPSMIWNNDTTLSCEGLQISPVKMVHMLRPSTIIEEFSVTDSETSVNSFQTAQKTVESTSCFDTANETLSSRSNVELNFNNLSYKKGHFFDSLETGTSSLGNHTGSFLSQETNIKAVTNESSIVDSCKFGPTILTDFADLACGLSSESLEDNANITTSNGNDSVIELSDDEDSNGQLNAGFSLQLNEDENYTDKTIDSNNQSLNFNDTIEEIQYIMSKGMQYLNENGAKSPMLVNSVHLLPIKSDSRKKSPSPSLFGNPLLSPATPKTNHIKKQDHNIGEKASSSSKIDLFKKPPNRNLQTKTLSAGKKKADMKHIISPVGAYIRKTPLTPTFKSIKPSSEVSNSKVIRDLEFDYNKPKKNNASPVCFRVNKDNTTCSLPRKAYISAEFKHVTDERTPLNIPGGEKIHRYLHQSKIPSVIRHDGKINMNMIPGNEYHCAATNENNIDKSLADLSLMSGDVSIYTIKDAQKFSK